MLQLILPISGAMEAFRSNVNVTVELGPKLLTHLLSPLVLSQGQVETIPHIIPPLPVLHQVPQVVLPSCYSEVILNTYQEHVRTCNRVNIGQRVNIPIIHTLNSSVLLMLEV